ncbi:MAG: DUF4177 domain-containing protein [Defluviimonas sp.]|nr:DUF4177 domain-containing protein [Defluviimonas sp.]
MQRYEYRVIIAPNRGEKVRGLKTTGERFAHAMTELMNDMARDGWEYVRADTLPCEERSGLTSRTTTYQNLLTFRRLAAETAAVDMPKALAAPEAAPGPAPEPAPAPPAPPAPAQGSPLPASFRLAGFGRRSAAEAARPGPEPAQPLRTDAPVGEAPRLASAAEPGKAPPLGPAAD